MNAASKGDKRGYSVADCWLGIDEGGTDATAPPLPPVTDGRRKSEHRTLVL